MAKVTLDALIPREDFDVRDAREQGVSITTGVKANDLEAGAFFYIALRKPDFQRETSEWSPQRVAGLIRTFLEDDLIPSVILWKKGEMVFVVDGGHRLSALVAWVQDDYGDGPRSLEFFDNDITDDQRRAAERTRKLIERDVGSYQSHLDAAKDPDSHSPAVVKRARRLGTLTLPLQWVPGDAKKAERSFVRINQQAAKVSEEELELIQNRRKPNVIASRAIVRGATGHQYWSGFDEAEQSQIKSVASEIHALMFSPQPRAGQKDSDLSAGGSAYAGTALRMVYDFTNICIETPTEEDDATGAITVSYLKRCRRVMQRMLSAHQSSLGLHPAVYFYGWNRKQQPTQFLAVATLVADMEKRKSFANFTAVRARFEEYLIRNRLILQQVLRQKGRKKDRYNAMLSYFPAVLEIIAGGAPTDDVVPQLIARGYSLEPPKLKSPRAENVRGEFSRDVKAGAVMRELVESALRCSVCGGLLPIQAVSIDHRQRLADGGASSADNAQLAHPYCNSGYKEALAAGR